MTPFVVFLGWLLFATGALGATWVWPQWATRNSAAYSGALAFGSVVALAALVLSAC